VFVELIGTLYCPRPHDPTPLLASVDRIAGRSVETGTLACPICDARYAVIDGAAVFDSARHAGAASGDAGPGRTSDDVTSDDVMKVAALLDLAEPGGFVLLGGAWSELAEPLAEATGVAVVSLNPPAHLSGRALVSPIFASGPLPLGHGSLRAALLDSDDAVAADAIAAAVRPRGRLAGPAAIAVPSGARELARDAELWVAERRVDLPGEQPPVVHLRRADRGQPSG
jgi:hypothetical protein